ncbi:hypothetical protein DDE18_17225 [Nocardioides gansuensis]|uniref:Uncharacterized protein n=2 Tax=Nocardioides gansuensis TaxID=2138300 RepID=A0A2T8F7N9_9ACTN|nr:hypothetical protein DDE18_17225 [Nocardioides gansuensis]
MTYGDFGDNFIRMVLHPRRVAESVDRVLGEQLVLGPMGAGPGRRVAKITAFAEFAPTTATLVPGELLTYRVELPVRVTFDLDLAVDSHRFEADVLVPLELIVVVEPPLTIVWQFTPPDPQQVRMTMATGTRRGALIQRVAGLDEELRQFLVKIVSRELSKPHVHRATHLDMSALIDGAWPALAAQFLPHGPEDRLFEPGWSSPAGRAKSRPGP